MTSHKKLVIVCILSLLAIVATTFGCSAPTPTPTQKAPTATTAPTSTPPPAATTPVKTITLKHSGILASTHLVTKLEKQFADTVAKRTNGQIKIQLYEAGSLVPGKEVLPAIRNNIIDMGDGSVNQWPGDVPFSSEAGAVPFAYDWAHIYKILDGLKPIMDEELKPNNAFVLWAWPMDNGLFLRSAIDASKPSFKGLKVRTYGGALNKLVQILGGSPVGMNTTEVSVALATGVVDGAFTSYDSYIAWNLFEQVPYIYMGSGVLAVANPVMMNLKTFNSLPPDVQKIMLEEAKVTERAYIEGVQQQLKTMATDLTAKKLKVTTFTPEQTKVWQALSKPIWDDLLTKYPEKGKRLEKVLIDAGAR